MGILDEAIREHLELKRQHGAGDSELKQLEDEAFGPPERPGADGEPPDPLAEAPTEFMAQPDVAEAPGEESPPEAPDEHPRREAATGILDLQEAPEPSAEEQPAAEHEVVADLDEAERSEKATEEPAAPEEAPPGPPAGHSTEERQAIAEQPTELFDVEEELAAAEPTSPSEEELVEEEMSAARLAPVDTLGALDDDDPEAAAEEPAVEAVPVDPEDEDFFSEQRLSDELDQALEAPSDPGPDEPAEPEPASAGTAEEEPPQPPAAADEDVLEETPDFLEGAPEDDELWFEQKPPKDFDFDD